MTILRRTPRARATGRRRVSALLALGLAVTASVAGALSTSGAASAGLPTSCSFSAPHEVAPGYSEVELTASAYVHIMKTTGGTLSYQGQYPGGSGWNAADSWRAYDMDLYAPGEITDATPTLCRYEPVAAPLAQTIDFHVLDQMRLGDPGQELVATSSASLPVTFTSATPLVCSVDGQTATVTPVGTGWCTVEADAAAGTGPDDEEYAAAATTPQTFRVLHAALPQTITFAQPGDMKLSAHTRQLAATASSELPVDYRSTTPGVCTVTASFPARRPARAAARRPVEDAGLVTAVSLGTCTIVASQTGTEDLWVDPGYRAAPEVTRSFRIVADLQAQKITVTGDHGVPLSARRADVRFTAPSGVVVRSTTPSVCAWDAKAGSAVVKKAGTCRLAATAPADQTWSAAPPVAVSLPVWAAPVLPAKAQAPRVLTALGRGEGALRVQATPAAVCRAVSGKVALTGEGTCRVTVTDGARTVRSRAVTVTAPDAAAPSAKDMDLVGSITFDFLSAKLKAEGKRTLRHLAPKLRKAQLVVVYGNTQAYGAGDTPANRKLSAARAKAVVAYLRGLDVDARATTVAMASTNPKGKDEAANRRADIYWIP